MEVRMCGQDLIPEEGDIVEVIGKESPGLVTHVNLDNSCFFAHFIDEDGEPEDDFDPLPLHYIERIMEKDDEERVDFIAELNLKMRNGTI